MEYNVSARNPNHALRDRMKDAAARADALLDRQRIADADATVLCDAVREYVRIRYLLDPDDMAQTEYLNHLGEMSLARGLGTSIETVRKNELDSKCEGTSSSMTKKILLVIALNKALGVAIDESTTADIATISDLCEAVHAELSKHPSA